jgi:uncharacterized MnhB-related membrane protein
MVFFDALLAGLLIALAWRAVTDTNLLRAIIQFIVLGMILALSWVRLDAPDVALAEAAVGGGLTGALLLAAARRQQRRERSTSTTAQGERV